MAGMLSTEELYFPEHEFGGPFWEHRQEWLKHNPSDYVEKWSVPQLVIHSVRDYRIPISEGLATFNVLQTRGIESQLLVFPDENHWVQKQANSLYWYTVVLNWICRHVGLAQYGEEDAISLLPGNEHYQREIVRL